MEPGAFREVVVARGAEASPIYRNLRRALAHVPFTTVDAREPFAAAERANGDFGAAKKNPLSSPAQR